MKMNSRPTILMSVFAVLAISCLGAFWLGQQAEAHEGATDEARLVKLYSGGLIVGQWTSKARVRKYDDNATWVFEEAESGKTVVVSGTVIMTSLEK